MRAALLALALGVGGCVSARQHARTLELLHQARAHNRACIKLVHEYERSAKVHPEQDFDSLDYGLAGH